MNPNIPIMSGGQLSDKTIRFAKDKKDKDNIFTGDLLYRAIETKNSNDLNDVVMHRGLETILKTKYGFNSPSYKGNCKILHEFDDLEKWQ